MVNLIFLLIVPAMGILSLVLSRFSGRMPSPEVITLSVMIANAALFGLGLLSGFSSFNAGINQAISFSFSLQENFITLPFLFLAITLPIAMLLFAEKEIKQSKNLFYLFYLIVYASVISVFMSSNLVIFFVFWELAVLSLFFITGLWGDKKKGRRAAMKFLVFTQFGSLRLKSTFLKRPKPNSMKTNPPSFESMLERNIVPEEGEQ